jgi:hypothetical protein
MPIAPIVGKLRKRFFLDVSTALGLGIAGGYAYWSVFSLFSPFSMLTRVQVWLPPQGP